MMSIKRFYQIDTSHLIIGSTSGTSKDAKLFVESQIERYCDIPKKSKYRIIKDGKDHWHFEIQENPVSGSVLDMVIQDIDENPETEIFIFGSDEEQYHIYKRPDGSLRTFIRKESERVMPVDEKVELLEGDQKALKDYFSLLYAWAWGTGVFFAISLSVALVAGFVSAGLKTSENGYREAISKAPISFLIENKLFTKRYESEPLKNLPGVGGVQAMTNYLDSGASRAIGKLVFNHGNWRVEPKRVPVSDDAFVSNKGTEPNNNN